MRVVSCFLVLVACVAYTQGLSCARCGTYPCPDVTCPKGVNKVKGVCNCCQVCAKQENEVCGGMWNGFGKCDAEKDLKCMKIGVGQNENMPEEGWIGTCLPEDTYENKRQKFLADQMRYLFRDQ